MNLSKILMLVFATIIMVSCSKDEEDKITIVSDRIITNTTWTADRVYVISGEIDVYNTILTIEPGTTIRFEKNASLRIGNLGNNDNSTLIANGTADKPITFTSAASNPVAGDWKGIQFKSNSYNNSMRYCTIQYAGTVSNGAIYAYNTSLAFSNNHILDAITFGMLLEYDASFTEMNNNTIERCGDHPIKMSASKVYSIGIGNVFNCPDGKGINIFDGVNDIEGTNNWKNLGKPYYVDDALDVKNGTLTIEPSTTIRFKPGASLVIGRYGNNDNSTLIANGSADKLITFTSAASTPVAGDWNGVQFRNNSYNNSMRYCTIQYAGSASNGAVYAHNTSLAFSNNHILDAITFGMLLEYDASFTEMNNNTIERCGDHPIKMSASKVYTIGTGNVFNCPDGKGIEIFDGVNDIEGPNNWKNLGKPYYVDDVLDVKNGTLSIEPGTTVRFKPGASLVVGRYGNNDNSTLIANGSADKLITFTSAASTPVAGDWNGIQFNNNSFNNSLKYCSIVYAGNGTNTNRAAIWVYNTNLLVHNCTIANSSGWGIYYNSGSTFEGINNVFQACALGEVAH